MLLRKPLFPGKNFIHQLTLIFEVIGSPKQREVTHIQNAQAKKFIESQSGKEKVSFRTVFPNASEDALELLEALLVFDPNNRIDAESVIEVPYIRTVASPRSLEFPSVSGDFDFAFEKISSKGQLKQMILDEALSFKRETRQTVAVTSAAPATHRHAANFQNSDIETGPKSSTPKTGRAGTTDDSKCPSGKYTPGRLPGYVSKAGTSCESIQSRNLDLAGKATTPGGRQEVSNIEHHMSPQRQKDADMQSSARPSRQDLGPRSPVRLLCPQKAQASLCTLLMASSLAPKVSCTKTTQEGMQLHLTLDYNYSHDYIYRQQSRRLPHFVSSQATIHRKLPTLDKTWHPKLIWQFHMPTYQL